MTKGRIWEGKRENSEDLYYEGQVFLANGCTQTVTKACESVSEAQYYLDIVVYGLRKNGYTRADEDWFFDDKDD